MTTVTLNPDSRLFVLRTGGGFTCLGFDVAFKRLKQYAEKLGRTAPSESEIGTLKQYDDLQKAESAYIQTNPKDTHFEPETHPQVQATLEAYRRSQKPLRVFQGEPQSGRDWLNEWDVYGRIGRSMGPLMVPLLVVGKDIGGSELSTSKILKLVDGASKAVLYQHPNYKTPVFEAIQVDNGWGVLHENVVHARFKTESKAKQWIDFMLGKRMTK